MPYVNKQHAVDTLMGPGWTISGQQPNKVTVPNPVSGYNEPATIQETQGELLTLVGPAGTTPDTIIIKQIGNAPWKGGVGYDVIQGPTKSQPKPPAEATPPSGLVRLDDQYNVITDPSKPATYVVDPKAPPGTAPYKLADDSRTGDPSKWTVTPADPSDPNGAKLIYDTVSQKIVATVPATAGSRASGEYVNVPDPNDPTGKRIIGLKDTGSNQIFSVSDSPSTGKQFITTPDKIYVYSKDGVLESTTNIEANKPLQAVVVDGQVYSFNPFPKPGEDPFTKGPEGVDAATLSIDTTARELIWYDKQGKEVARQQNTNYQPPRPILPAQSLTAPKVPIEDPDNPGKIIWIDNEGRVTIGQATQNLIQTLTGQTVDPDHPMTLDEARTVIDAAVAQMNADTQRQQVVAQREGTAAGAAQNILSTQAQGAQTGAGILQQRQATTQGLIQQGLGIAGTGASRSGNYGGGMLSAPQGFGANLVGGAAGFATELGGGQAVYDTAVRMVQAADPNNQNPDRAAAVATLTQVMDRYKQATGQDYPTVAATRATQQSAATGGFVPPPTINPAAVTPEVFQAQYDPRLNPAAPQQPAGTVLPPGVAGTIAPGSPGYIGTVAQPRSAAELSSFTAPSQTVVDLARGLGYASARY